MKKMVENLVYEVRSEAVRANISHESNSVVSTKSTSEKKPSKRAKGITAEKCPKCKNGTLLKGSSAYGCSDYKNRCKFIMPFSFLDKKISENQFVRLLQKGSTVNLKGFKINENEVEGLVRFDENFNLKLEEKRATKSTSTTDSISCPACKKGTVLKGKTAYGCSEYKNGCTFLVSFDTIRQKAAGKTLTKELVINILNENR